MKQLYAACTVLIERDSGVLAGFYTLSATMIPLADIPAEISRKLPRSPIVPAALIGWLGRDERLAGQGIGSLLLYDAIHQVAASHLGSMPFLPMRSTTTLPPFTASTNSHH